MIKKEIKNGQRVEINGEYGFVKTVSNGWADVSFDVDLPDVKIPVELLQ